MGSVKGPTNPAGPGTFGFADVVIDAGAHRLLREGREIPVEPKAFAVLLEFLSRPGQLLSRDQLLDAVWGHAYVTPATLNRIIAQLRKALGDASENPRFIQTVHGLGYRFIAPVQQAAPEGSSSLRFAPPARARIPERAGALIGRDHDVGELRRLLHESRLVTVTGPGGIGKTQAALETARTLAADFPDGVWLFDCTMQTGEQGLARLLAGTFEIRTEHDLEDLAARLGELLHARRALLVFDNSELIVGPLGRLLTSLLAACADLRALVTSQRRLNGAGESLYALPALELPPPGEWSSEEQMASLSRVAAVQLLLMRSRTFASGFALTAANASDVVQLCHRLAGLPLALELAAARLRLLSPEQLLARMEDRPLALAEHNPNRPARHQALRSLIEWSFALLSEGEQALLCGLSIFAGACTLGGATAMGAALGLDESQTLDLLGGLMDKSLLSMDVTTNPPSYRLLDSVRLFAQERLAVSGNEPSVRKAHLAYFVQLTERVNSELLGERQHVWYDRIKREWANLHAAFDFALAQQGLDDSAVALVGNLCWYFRGNTDYAQSAQWLERALQAAQGSTRYRARALIALGTVLHHCQAHDRSAPRLREGIALAGRLGETWLAGAGEAVLAFEFATCGDFSAAETCVRAALGIAESRDDSWLRSMALLGRGIALALNDLHVEAEASLSESLDWASLQGDFFQWAYVQINLALQRHYLGDGRAAQDWLENMQVFLEIRNWRGAAGCVEGAAYLAAEHGQPESAARFLAAAARVRELTGAPLMPHWRKAQQRAEREAQEALGREFRRVQQASASARFEDVVTEARTLLLEVAAQPGRTGANNPSGS